MSSNSYDIVTVGSGHNGLVAAAYLAAGGKKVLVLERNAWFGGMSKLHRRGVISWPGISVRPSTSVGPYHVSTVWASMRWTTRPSATNGCSETSGLAAPTWSTMRAPAENSRM
jgi:glycine/D-amino acid oxidase-like deaminating enzyme